MLCSVFLKFLLGLWLCVAPEAIRDQRAQYHGEVGSANADLAAEEERWQPPGNAVAPSQTGALLKNRQQMQEKCQSQSQNGNELQSASFKLAARWFLSREVEEGEKQDAAELQSKHSVFFLKKGAKTHGSGLAASSQSKKGQT